MNMAGRGFASQDKSGTVKFCQFWAGILKRWKHHGVLEGLTATQPRSIYIEGVTSTLGVDYTQWQGYASAMGNTVRTWQRNYAHTLRERGMQNAADTHHGFKGRVLNRPLATGISRH